MLHAETPPCGLRRAPRPSVSVAVMGVRAMQMGVNPDIVTMRVGVGTIGREVVVVVMVAVVV